MNKYVKYIFTLCACSCGLLAHGPAELWTSLNALATQSQTGASLANTQDIRGRCVDLHVQLQELRNRVGAHKTSGRSRAILDELLARVQSEVNLASNRAYVLSQAPVQDTGLWAQLSRAIGLRANVNTQAYEEIVQTITNAQSKFAQIAATIEQARANMVLRGPTFMQRCKNAALHLMGRTYEPAIDCHPANDSVLLTGLHAALTDPQERSQDMLALLANGASRVQAFAANAAAQAVTAAKSLAHTAHAASNHLSTVSNPDALQIASLTVWGIHQTHQLSQSSNTWGAALGGFVERNIVSGIIDPAHISWVDKWVNAPLERITGRRIDGWLNAYSQSSLASRVHACARWLQEKTEIATQKLGNVAAKIQVTARAMQAKSRTCVNDITHDFAAINIAPNAPVREHVRALIGAH